MTAHDVFTGSAGADRCGADGWSHTVPDAVPVLGRPERYAAARPAADRWHPVVWWVATTVCLCVLAALTRPALALALWILGYLP